MVRERVMYDTYLDGSWLMSSQFFRGSTKLALENAIENAREWGEYGHLTVYVEGEKVASYFVE